MSLNAVKEVAFRTVLAAYGLGDPAKTAMPHAQSWPHNTDLGLSRHNHVAESNANSDTLQSLLAAFDRKPATTGDESGVGTPFMEGTTG